LLKYQLIELDIVDLVEEPKEKTTVIRKKKKLNEEEIQSYDANKYWYQRYSLFSKFDEGIMIDEGCLLFILIIKNKILK